MKNTPLSAVFIHSWATTSAAHIHCAPDNQEFGVIDPNPSTMPGKPVNLGASTHFSEPHGNEPDSFVELLSAPLPSALLLGSGASEMTTTDPHSGMKARSSAFSVREIDRE